MPLNLVLLNKGFRTALILIIWIAALNSNLALDLCMTLHTCTDHLCTACCPLTGCEDGSLSTRALFLSTLIISFQLKHIASLKTYTSAAQHMIIKGWFTFKHSKKKPWNNRMWTVMPAWNKIKWIRQMLPGAQSKRFFYLIGACVIHRHCAHSR